MKVKFRTQWVVFVAVLAGLVVAALMPQYDEEIVAGALIVGASAACAFPVIYSRSPWRTTLPGRSVMLLSIIIAVTLTLGVFRALGSPAPDWTRAPVYIGIAFGLWYQLGVLLKVRSRNYRPSYEVNYGRRVTDHLRESAGRGEDTLTP